MPSTHTLSDTAHVPRPLLHAIAERWWLFLLKGIAAIIFGVLAFIWPGMTLLTLVLLYGIFALTDGALALIGAIRGSEYASRWWLAIVGLLGIAAGAIALLWPGISGMALLICIAIWAIATGIMQIVGAISMRHQIDDEWLLIAGGALSVIFGGLLLTRPGAGAVAVAYVIAAYAIMYGVLMVMLALRLHKLESATGHPLAGE
jgi:uncharacterized membrane protein HdeD (DUF308 family)